MSDEIQRNDSLSVALARHELGGLEVDGVVRALQGLFPKAEAFLDGDALIELQPKTGPPAPPDRQLLLPLVG